MEPLGVAGLTIGLITLAQSTIQLVSKVSALNFRNRFLVHRDHIASFDERFRLDVEILLDDAQVDIVFIHGLEGSRGEGAVKFSHRDISRLFSANILTYSYDTTLRSSEFLLGRTLRHEGIQLIRRLVHLRSNRMVDKRPIIFVAHSLGGILLKNALVLSEMSSSKDEEEICRSTVGIVFLNTPQERAPNSFAASIWDIVHLNLHPEDLQDPKWQKDDFFINARSLAYHTNCFEPIAKDLITPPIHLNISAAEVGHSGFDNSHKLLFNGLWSIIEHLNSHEYHSDHVSSHVNAKVVVLDEVSHDSSVVTNLPGMELFRKQGTCPCGLCAFKSNLKGRGDIVQLHHAPGQLALHFALKSGEEILISPSKIPDRSIFVIKATNRASIGLSCLGIYRKILLHYSSQRGPATAEELLGIRGIDRATDSKILSQPEMLASIIEAVAHWLRKPQNNHWLLVIEDMAMEKKHFTANVAHMGKLKDSTLMILLNSMLIPRHSPARECRVIYTSSNQDTKDGLTTSRGEPICSLPAPRASIYSKPGLDGMDDVVRRILRLCITLSDESTWGITTEVIHQCDDIIANTAEPAIAKSKTEDAFQYLRESGILELCNTHNSRIEFLRVHKSIKRHRLSPGLPSRDEIALAWTCLEKTVKWISRQKDLIELWDLGSSLVESCSAVVRQCYEIQESLESLDVNSILLGELCERHSAYATATILYESAYSQRRPKLCRHRFDSFSFDIEATHKLARIYFLSGVMDKAKEKNDETIKMLRESHKASKALSLDTFRLDAALNAAKGNLETATNKLEQLLEDLGGYDRDSDLCGETIDYNAAFLSVVRDLANYLVHSGDYKGASLLLQRALLSQKRHPSRNQPLLLALNEALAILKRRQGELREAEGHYLAAHDILDLWVGNCHPNAALNLASCAVTIGLQGRNEEATRLFRTALGKARYCLGIQHQEVCHIQELLVLCLAAGGHYESAMNELLELEKNFNATSGDSVQLSTTRARHYKKSLEISRIDLGVYCHKDEWLKELELVEDEASGNRQMIFLERQNELLSNFFFYSF